MNEALLRSLLLTALQSLDTAEQYCTKPVMTTPIGQDIAQAHSLVMDAWKRLGKGEKP